MRVLYLLAAALALIGYFAPLASSDIDSWTICETVNNRFGGQFVCDDFVVTTEDGYELTIQRVRALSFAGQSLPVMYLQHGLLDSGFTWVANEPSESLGMYAAMNGYEVWLGNSRGRSLYGSASTVYSVDSDDFWNFNWNEMAQYDLPATVDFILATSGAAKLVYVGHSQGTMIGFAAFSTNADVSSKISTFVALAPVAYLSNLGLPFLRLLAKVPSEALYLAVGRRQILGLGLPIPSFLCSLDESICDNVVCMLAGCMNSNTFNSTQLPVITAHFPMGTSVQNLVMYSQAVNSGNFQMFDYGTSGNMQHYNQPTPPQYDLSKLMVPSIIYYGTNDVLADPTDVAKLLSQIPTPLAVTELEFGHADFVWSINATQMVYTPLLQKLASLQ